MVGSAAACVRGRTGPSRAGEAGRSQYQKVLASPMTPIRRRYPCVIRTCGVVESTISVERRLPALEHGRAPILSDRLRALGPWSQLGLGELAVGLLEADPVRVAGL